MTKHDKRIQALLTEMNTNEHGWVYSVSMTPYNQHEAHVSHGTRKHYMFGYHTRKELYTALHAVYMHTLSTRLFN
jgi:hypothetical protein